MGSYSVLRIEFFEFRFKWHIPPILSFLFDKSDATLVWDKEDDDDSEDDWIDEAGYKSTVIKAKELFEEAGYNLEYFTKIFNEFKHSIEQDYYNELEYIYKSLTLEQRKSYDYKFSSYEDHISQLNVSTVDNDISIFVDFLKQSYDKNLNNVVLSISGTEFQLPKISFDSYHGVSFFDLEVIQTYVYNNLLDIPIELYRIMSLYQDDIAREYSDIVLLISVYVCLNMFKENSGVSLDYPELVDIDNPMADIMDFHPSAYDSLKRKLNLYNISFRNLLNQNSELKKKHHKFLLKSKWSELINQPNPQNKGLLLEEFMVELFKVMDGFVVVNKRLDVGDEEIDIIIKNKVSDPFWVSFGSSTILVECKNWSSKVGTKYIRDFESKLRNHSNFTKMGIFIATHGFTKECKEFLKRIGREDKLLMLISGSDIKNYIDTEIEFKEWLEEIVTSMLI